MKLHTKGSGLADLRVLIAGGGTGGHIIPALAVARELVAQHKAEVLFVGTARGMETRLVPEAGFNLRLIEVGPLKNVSLLTRLRTLIDLPRSIYRVQEADPRIPAWRGFRRGRLRLRPGDGCRAPAQSAHHGLRAQRHAGAGKPAGGQARECSGGQLSRGGQMVSQLSRSPAFPCARSFSRSKPPVEAPRLTCWSLADRRARASSISTLPRILPGLLRCSARAHGSASERRAPS